MCSPNGIMGIIAKQSIKGALANYLGVLIGAVTFIISGIGVKIGNVFGARFKSKAELAGGIILILLGIKILTEHLVTGG